MMGTAGLVARFAGMFATGVVSPGTANGVCIEDEGVVGAVECTSSEAG